MPNINFKFNNSAFTLIELLVAIGIMAIIGAVAIPNFRNFSQTQEIDNAALSLINTLRKAQSSASSRINCPNGEPTSSWQVNLKTSTSNDTYELVANCATSSTSQIVYSGPFAATPTSTTTFSGTNENCGTPPSTENLTIHFTGLGVVYQCDSATTPSSGTVTITLSGGGLSKKVKIDSGGIIGSE